MKIVDKQKALSGGYPLKLIMEEIDKLKSLDHPAVLRLFAAHAAANKLVLTALHFESLLIISQIITSVNLF